MTLKCIHLWRCCSGAFGSLEYPFIGITSRSTQTRSDSACWGPIYALCKFGWELFLLTRNIWKHIILQITIIVDISARILRRVQETCCHANFSEKPSNKRATTAATIIVKIGIRKWRWYQLWLSRSVQSPKDWYYLPGFNSEFSFS